MASIMRLPHSKLAYHIQTLQDYLVTMEHGRGEVAHLIEDIEAKKSTCVWPHSPYEEEWFLDLGATSCIIGNKKSMVELQSSSTLIVRLVGDAVMHVLNQEIAIATNISRDMKQNKNCSLCAQCLHRFTLSRETYSSRPLSLVHFKTLSYL
jgi:hypothetical protein